MKQITRMISLLLCVVMMAGIVPLSAFAAANSFDMAEEILFDTVIDGELKADNKSDYYKVILLSSGKLTIDFTSSSRHTDLILHDEKKETVWSEYCNELKEGRFHKSIPTELVSGTYYLKIAYKNGYSEFGSYQFTVTFKSSNETFPESQNIHYDALDLAREIDFDKQYNGQIALNDWYDYYKVTLPSSGKLTIDYTSSSRHTDLILYNEKKETVWSEYCNELKEGRFHKSIPTELVSGTYYLKIAYKNGYSEFGSYQFIVTFKSSNETFPESQSQQFNTYETAPEITIGGNHTGQIAYNDSVDIYKLDLETRRTFRIEETAGNDTLYRIENYDHQTVWNNEKRSGTLESGVYYLIVNKTNSNTGKYSFLIYTECDVDGDGSVTPADARITLRMSVGLVPTVEKTAAFAAADFNRNGKIQADDARSILRVSVGLEP